MDIHIRIGIIAGACALMLLTACSSKLDKVREGFIDSCENSGGASSMCECAIDKLQAHYGEKGLVAIEEGGYPPPDFIDRLAIAGQQCREE